MACGDSGESSGTSFTTGPSSAPMTTTGVDPTTGGPTTGGPTTGTSSTGEDDSTGAPTTAVDPTTQATTGDATTDDPSTGTTGPVDCADQPEVCDALDNNCNNLYDEGCDCTPPDLELTALEGYTARVIASVSADIGAYGLLGDVERAIDDYWGLPGEGLLFTVNDAGNTRSGIGVLDQDGAFQRWLVDPATSTLAVNPYLEYAYGGVLYACTTVNGDWIYKIYPDGTVETVVHHGNCEGLIYGDRGDGQPALYASNYQTSEVVRIEESGARTLVVQDGVNLPIVVDLALPRPGSAFAPGLYTINQTLIGVHRIDPANAVTLEYPYSSGFGVGEEMSFADPNSAFRDHFYHLSATLNAVVRVKPDGTWEEILTGPKLNYGLYSTGGVFSTNGAYYFFTNEDDLIMRLQACNAAGQ
jgi:hypothetical protein